MPRRSSRALNAEGLLAMKILDIPRSGSFGGTTSSHNRAGQYVRNRRSPVQPIGTGRRAFIRAAFGAAAAGYAALSSTDQAAWISFAETHPVTDSLGQSIKLTGQQMFVGVGTQLANIGSPLPTLPPASTTTSDVNGMVPAFSVATGFSATGAAGDGTGFITVAFSQPLSAGRRFWKTFWQQQSSADDALTITATTAVYAAQFGTPVVGQAIFVKFTPVNSEGWSGTPNIVRMIVGV